MKTQMYVVVLTLLSFVASATDFNLRTGVTDWSSIDSYTVGGEPATTLPGAGDVIVLPAETFTLAASDAKFTASIDQINVVKQVSIPKGAKLIIDVGESDVTISCVDLSAVTGNSSLLHTGNGVVEKLGSGVLRLVTAKSSHVANLEISEGTVFAYSSGSLYFGAVTVAKGAEFRPGKVDSATFPVIRGPIMGEGLISSVEGATKAVNLCAYWISSASEVFAGTIGGKASLSVRADAAASVTGLENTFTEGVTLAGRLDVGKIGKVADVSSSIGTKSSVVFGYSEFGTIFSGTLGYLGVGADETDRLFSFHYSQTPNVIDGGANGGLVLANEWTGDAQKDKYPSQQRVVLTGNGVMRGYMDDIVTDGGTYSFYVTKKGEGIWTIEENADNKMAGVWAAEEGTLRFASLRDAGVNCAFGFSTNLYDDVWGAENMTEGNRVDYAFLLGGTNAVSPGTMEYTGTDFLRNTTRKVAVKGTGRLTATTAQTAYANVISAKAGETATLVLDGPAGATNDLADVTDGDGTLNLVKSGAGVWRLVGDNGFSGSVAVTGGTLVVSTPDVSKYSYYRITLKENYYTTKGMTASSLERGNSLMLAEFALYDSDKSPISVGVTNVVTPIAMEAGRCAFTCAAGAIDGSEGLYKWFDFNGNTYPQTFYADYAHASRTPSRANPASWQQVELRLPAESGPAAYYDVACGYGKDDSAAKYGMNPTVWKIEASCDGYTWETVKEEDDASDLVPAKNLSWYSDGVVVNTRKKKAAPTNNVERLTLARTVPAKTVFKPFGNAKSVRVDASATLVKEGPGVVAVNELVIDKARGLGTISGFTLEENSTLAVDGVAKSDVEIDLPGTLDIAGLDEAMWTLKVNGTVSTKYDVVVRSTGVKLVKRGGLMLICR